MTMSARYDEARAALRATPKRFLVTGGAGFIGSHLVDALVALGQSVVVLDNLATGNVRNLAHVRDRIAFIEGDIADQSTCETSVRGVDIVLHQAALGSVPRSIEHPLATHRANVDGFVGMLRAAQQAGVQRFVYASSSSVYGDAAGLPKREEVIGQPLSPYAASKRINEIYAQVFQTTYGFECIGLRYFNVFGPRQDPQGPYAAVIPRFLAHMMDGSPCTIHGDGSTSRDFCYVANAVQANLLAAVAPSSATHCAYNVACGAQTSLLELHAALAGSVATPQPAPLFASPRKGDVQHSLADITRAREALGYAPTYSVTQGIAETVKSWRQARDGSLAR
jgi:UDP-N-acetylglucosamine/UDP-N-acetylgalactosamine 4-epimerase